MATKTISIPQGNKLIAVFDGYKYISDGEVFFKQNSFGRDEIIPLPELRYHLSFDPLMDVINKIEAMGFYVSIQKSNITCCKDGGISPVYENYGYKDKREAVWEAVVAFIMWYNKNKK